MEPTVVVTETTTFPTLRINCGTDTPWISDLGDDDDGTVWQSDAYFGGNGGAYDAGLAIPGGGLYGTERFFSIYDHPQPFAYDIPVSVPGEYAVILHFAEVFFQLPGSRVFDVWVEGSLVVDSLDVFDEVGYKTPLELPVVTQVSDGSLTIEFVAIVENPKVSGIEIIDIRNYVAPTAAPTTSVAPSESPTASPAPSTSPAPTPTPDWTDIYINCGGGDFEANDGLKTWVMDTPYVTGGAVYSDGSQPIDDTLDDGVFHSERNGVFSYEIPLRTNSYEVTVFMAEL